MNDQRAAKGQPSKAFFVDMITRDLTVEDSILDLIDNAIDAAVTRQDVDVMTVLPGHEHNKHRFSKATIAINIDDVALTINDTCGGMSIKDAEEVVFRFGNPGVRSPSGGLSVYGIGMKRSFFKLGRNIRVNSQTKTDRFSVTIDVEAWTHKGDDDWDFEFSEAEKLRERPEHTGTEITIEELTSDTRRRFAAPGFAKDLLKRIESAYALFLMAGVEIKVNGRAAVSQLPAEVLKGKRINSAPKQFSVDGVSVYIIVGVSPPKDRQRHGWYVFCNGRMVLNADKSDVTGWGRDAPQWHTKFGHFVGYLYFRSSDVTKLPWRTTKQGVVTELAVYQEALAEMQVQMRPVLGFLSKLYPGEATQEDVPERSIMKEAKGVSITSLSQAHVGFRVTAKKSPKDPDARLISIQYKKRRGDIERLKRCVKLLRGESAKRVGEYAFEYLMKQECSE